MKSLFGDSIEEVEKRVTGTYASWKSKNQYRKATGEERCGECQHLVGRCHHGKGYWKCEIMGFSNSSATDIRKSYVCKLFKDASTAGKPKGCK